MGSKKRKASALTDQAVSSSSRRSRRRRRHRRKDRPTSRRERRPEWRDWAALPGNVLCAILGRLQIDILCGTGAGLACASWRRAAVEDPLLWRRIDLADTDGDKEKEPPAWWRAMARTAVDRSAGQCESFRGRVDGDFMLYLAKRAPSLRSLRVTRLSVVPGQKLIAQAMEKLPMLEQLVVSNGLFEKPLLCAVLDHCPRLHLLDARGCITFTTTGKRLVARCESRIKNLWLPRLPRGCSCCRRRAQKIADEEDK
ncbi:putative F-box/LRR-repeat protein 23 [Lolium perenne]|uniref:putative F-box/LRR-repeat protein 23 n=1 Tax=Lolium perenne TaxID=4522 RepID=UPI0021F60195|nr:putative F-box/LRR-repeat protein 22 [Lolium perenne]